MQNIKIPRYKKKNLFDTVNIKLIGQVFINMYE